MKVDIRGTSGPSQKAGDSSKLTSTKAPQGSARTPAKTTTGDDTVSLTSSATQLQALSALTAELPIVDSQLVSEVQISLATGTFNVRPDEAADNLLTQERELAQLEAQD